MTWGDVKPDVVELELLRQENAALRMTLQTHLRAMERLNAMPEDSTREIAGNEEIERLLMKVIDEMLADMERYDERYLWMAREYLEIGFILLNRAITKR